jgi:hypothetical protein
VAAWTILKIDQNGELPIMQNVDIRLADLPISHRFLTWNITRNTPFDNFRRVFRWIAECRVIRICPCREPLCATTYLTLPDDGDPPYETGTSIFHTNKGSLYTQFVEDWIKIEALGDDFIRDGEETTQTRTDELRDQKFPHSDELNRALESGHAPTQPVPACKARAILRDWLSGLEESPAVSLEVDTL